jgi:hypothetical protein
MQLKDIDDPRDKWRQARRIELVRYAEENGHPEIDHRYPANLIILKLKALGLPPPSVPDRRIGSSPRAGDTTPNSHHAVNGPPKPKAETITIDADELLEREFEETLKPAIKNMTYREMRAELKASGMVLNRRWSKQDIINELEQLRNGQQNAT